jgi:hypothetical protein
MGTARVSTSRNYLTNCLVLFFDLDNHCSSFASKTRLSAL